MQHWDRVHFLQTEVDGNRIFEIVNNRVKNIIASIIVVFRYVLDLCSVIKLSIPPPKTVHAFILLKVMFLQCVVHKTLFMVLINLSTKSS